MSDEFPSEFISLLGKVSDNEVARISGRYVSEVVRVRNRLGIRAAASMMSLEWLEAAFGKFPDTVIAEKAKRSRERIRQCRKKAGVPLSNHFKTLVHIHSKSPTGKLTMRRELDEFVRRVEAGEDLTNYEPAWFSMREKQYEEITRSLDLRSNKELRAEHHVSNNFLLKERKARGIPSNSVLLRLRKKEWLLQAVGKFPDNLLADHLGVKAPHITYLRKTLKRDKVPRIWAGDKERIAKAKEEISWFEQEIGRGRDMRRYVPKWISLRLYCGKKGSSRHGAPRSSSSNPGIETKND